MNFERNIRLFFVKYGRRLFILVLIVLATLFILRTVNNLVDDNSKDVKQNSNKVSVSEKEQREDEKIIEQFVEYCNKGELENAYNMLSSNCKIEKYKTIQEFKSKYYGKIFSTNQEINIKLTDEQEYEILFTGNTLITGKVIETTDTYYLTKEESGKKININIHNEIKGD